MHRAQRILFFAVTLGFICASNLAFTHRAKSAAGNQKAEIAKIEKVLSQALARFSKVKDQTGTFHKRERFGNKMRSSILEFKVQQPSKFYIKFVTPHKGREAIYVKGWNEGKVRAHKGSFPDITINAHPHSKRPMENNHHPIYAIGQYNSIKLAEHNIQRAIKSGKGSFKVSDGGVISGQAVWKIEIKAPKDGETIIAKEKDTLWRIAKRTGQNMYVILHHNEDIDSPKDVDEGDKVFIPHHYASRIEYLTAKDTGAFLKITSWDHAGRLYEVYEYKNQKFDVGLTDKDFDPENPAYDF